MYTLIWRSACFSPTVVSPLRSSPVSITSLNFVVFRVMSLNTVCVFVPIASVTSSCLPSMTFLDSLLFHACAPCHWLTSSLNWTLISAVLELYHPFTDAFLYMPSSHLLIMTLPVANSSRCHLSQYRAPNMLLLVLVLINPTCCIICRLPTLSSLFSRKLSCCCIHTTSVLRVWLISPNIAFLILLVRCNYFILVPDFVTSLYTLPPCVICEHLFRWDKQLFRFTCHNLLFYASGNSLYMLNFVVPLQRLAVWMYCHVFHPLDITRSQAGQCLLCLTPSCSHPGCC